MRDLWRGERPAAVPENSPLLNGARSHWDTWSVEESRSVLEQTATKSYMDCQQALTDWLMLDISATATKQQTVYRLMLL